MTGLGEAPSSELAIRAVEELHQLGYTVRDGLLYPPRIELPGPEPEEAQSEALRLHARIMNIPHATKGLIGTVGEAYAAGHRDARHAAAEIASEAEARLATVEAGIERRITAIAADRDYWREHAATVEAERDRMREALERVCTHAPRSHEQIAADWDNARAALTPDRSQS